MELVEGCDGAVGLVEGCEGAVGLVEGCEGAVGLVEGMRHGACMCLQPVLPPLLLGLMGAEGATCSIELCPHTRQAVASLQAVRRHLEWSWSGCSW